MNQAGCFAERKGQTACLRRVGKDDPQRPALVRAPEGRKNLAQGVSLGKKTLHYWRGRHTPRISRAPGRGSGLLPRRRPRSGPAVAPVRARRPSRGRSAKWMRPTVRKDLRWHPEEAQYCHFSCSGSSEYTTLRGHLFMRSQVEPGLSCDEYCSRVRDLINEPRVAFQLQKDPPFWNQLCSSLDVIGDTELAMESYPLDASDTPFGLSYLLVYGLLQAMYLQQDAVFNLCESLGIPQGIDNHPKLKAIRDIRNKSTGHPTKKDKPKPTSYHFIARASLTPRGFDLHTASPGQPYQMNYVCVADLISDQREGISKVLALVVQTMEKRDEAHRRSSEVRN